MHDLPPCSERGAIRGDVCECRSTWLRSPPEGVALTFCRTCPYRNRPPRAPACLQRGEVLTQRPADLCGLRNQLYDVHACAIHGECVTRRTCRKQLETFCGTCPDRQPD